MAPEAPPPSPPQRIGVIDAVRGLAITGMVVFHLGWDLTDLGFVQAHPTGSPAWRGFGDMIAVTFLALSGIGLVLGRARGPAHALRRIGMILAGALTVTAATEWLFPQDAITFGILHCIVATNLVGLVLLDAPTPVLLGLAGASLLAPLVFTTGPEGPYGWWLGLSKSLPRTLDYRPVFPWLGFVLIGVAIARVLPMRTRPAFRHPVTAGLAFAGRHSLGIYLLHQPILFGLLSGLAAIAPPVRTDVAHTADAAFRAECQSQCIMAGAGPAACGAACACAAQRLPDTLKDQAEVGSIPQLETLSRSCTRPASTSP